MNELLKKQMGQLMEGRPLRKPIAFTDNLRPEHRSVPGIHLLWVNGRQMPIEGQWNEDVVPIARDFTRAFDDVRIDGFIPKPGFEAQAIEPVGDVHDYSNGNNGHSK